MEQKLQATSGREYVELDPDTQLAQEEDCDTLLVFLPGFKKEQLRLQLTTSRTLKLTGERPLPNNKWLRVQREYPVSPNCDTNKIAGKLEDGILYLRQPKLILTPAILKQEKEKEASSEPQKPDPKPANNHQLAQPQKTDVQETAPMAAEQPKEREEKKSESKPANNHQLAQPQKTDAQETAPMAAEQPKEREEKKSESEDGRKGDDDKGELERGKTKEELEEGKRDGGGVEEYGKGMKGKTSTEGQESCGWVGSRAAAAVEAGRRRPVGSVVLNLVVGILLAIVIGIYVRNWINKSAKEEYGKK